MHATITVALLALLAAQAPAQPVYFGLEVQNALQDRSEELFCTGFLSAPASEADFVPRENAIANDRVLLAPGLQVEL